MSKNHQNHKEKEEQNDKTAQNTTPSAAEQPTPESASVSKETEPRTVQITEEELKSLQAKVRDAEELKESLLRKAADFENAKKRLTREKDDFVKYASEKLMESFLPVLDNLDHALSHGKHDNAESIMTGVTLIKKQIMDVLKNNGLVPIESVGAHFDPHIHEAVGMIETDAHAPDTVVEEVRCGYMLKDKLLRPSWVRVAQSTSPESASSEPPSETTAQ